MRARKLPKTSPPRQDPLACAPATTTQPQDGPPGKEETTLQLELATHGRGNKRQEAENTLISQGGISKGVSVPAINYARVRGI